MPENLVTIRSFAREKNATTTPGDSAEIRGGLPELFAYLADVDWPAFERGLSKVAAGGFRADLPTGTSVVVLIRPSK